MDPRPSAIAFDHPHRYLSGLGVPFVIREHLREVLPHYLAMFLAVLVVVSAVRVTVGRPDLLVELAVVVAVCILYMLAARRLGVAPSSWERP